MVNDSQLGHGHLVPQLFGNDSKCQSSGIFAFDLLGDIAVWKGHAVQSRPVLWCTLAWGSA